MNSIIIQNQIQEIPAIFLSQHEVVSTADATENRMKLRYCQIALCSLFVIGLAVMISCLITGPLILSSIPWITPGVAPAAYASTELAGLIILTLGGTLGGPTVGGLSTIPTCIYRHYILKRFKRAIQDIRDNLQPQQRIDKQRLKVLLQSADQESLKIYLSKMDFNQLYIAKRTIGRRKFAQLLRETAEATKEQHRIWKQILELDQAVRTPDSLNAKLAQANIYHNENRYPLYKLALFETVRENNYPLEARVSAVCKWLSHTREPEDHDDTIRLIIQQNEHPETAQTIQVRRDMLTKSSEFFSIILDESDLKWGDDLDTPIAVDNVEVFKETIRLLEGNAQGISSNKSKLKRILQSAYKQLDRFADTLQHIFSESELRKFARENLVFNNYLLNRECLYNKA